MKPQSYVFFIKIFTKLLPIVCLIFLTSEFPKRRIEPSDFVTLVCFIENTTYCAIMTTHVVMAYVCKDFDMSIFKKG